MVVASLCFLTVQWLRPRDQAKPKKAVKDRDREGGSTGERRKLARGAYILLGDMTCIEQDLSLNIARRQADLSAVQVGN
jgi:hypothetical protein